MQRRDLRKGKDEQGGVGRWGEVQLDVRKGVGDVGGEVRNRL